MMVKIIFFAFSGLVFSINLDAQTEILQKAVTSFKTLKNISYSVDASTKDLFSDAVHYKSQDVLISRANDSQQSPANNHLFRVKATDSEKWYDGNKLIIFNFVDSTYSFPSYQKSVGTHYELLSEAIVNLQKDLMNKYPIIQYPDTLIRGNIYYKLRITERDTMVNNKRTFRYITWVIDKSNMLPYIYRNDQEGFIDGSNIFVAYFSEHRFANYKRNDSKFANLAPIRIPDYFSLEKPKVDRPLLAKGTDAPDLDLYDSTGAAFSLESQKGKIVLLNFTLNGCPHCVKSVEMLNKLYAKYKSSEFVIVTINPVDNKESITKNNQMFGVRYPTYINPDDSKKNVDNFHIDAYPVFYLLDQQGKISASFSGYYYELDKKIIAQIEALKK